MEILRTENLKKYYEQGASPVKAIDGVDISVAQGEFVAIVGTSGSGKSTLLNMLGGLDRPTAGKVFVDGKDIFSLKDEELTIFRRRKIGFVFQSVALIPVMTAYENVDFGLRTANYQGDRNERIKEVLEKVGLSDRAKHFPGELSGGERQRIAIARAMAHKPELLFADEPTGALDTTTGIYIAELFKNMTRTENLSIVMTTHDVRLAELADVLIQL